VKKRFRSVHRISNPEGEVGSWFKLLRVPFTTHSTIVSVSPITATVTKGYSFEVEIPPGTGGLCTRSKIMVNQTSPEKLLHKEM